MREWFSEDELATMRRVMDSQYGPPIKYARLRRKLRALRRPICWIRKHVASAPDSFMGIECLRCGWTQQGLGMGD